MEQDPHFRAVAEAIPQVDVAASAEAQMAQRTKAMHRSTILISAAASARATRSAVPVASDEKQGFVSSRVWKTYVLAAGVGLRSSRVDCSRISATCELGVKRVFCNAQIAISALHRLA